MTEEMALELSKLNVFDMLIGIEIRFGPHPCPYR